MKLFIATLALIFNFSLIAYAQNTSTGLDQQKLHNLIQTAIEKGQSLDAGDYEYRALTHLDPADKTQSHLADYLSAVGGTDSQGQFYVARVEGVSENWKKTTTGGWEIEQWMWSAKTDGTLVNVQHGLLTEDADGRVLDDVYLPVGKPTDPDEMTRWNHKLEDWFGFYPSSFLP